MADAVRRKMLSNAFDQQLSPLQPQNLTGRIGSGRIRKFIYLRFPGPTCETLRDPWIAKQKMYIIFFAFFG